MHPAAEKLPDDPVVLKEMLLAAQKDAARQRALLDKALGDVEALEQLLRLYRRQRFGASSEKLANQLLLFNEAEVEEVDANEVDSHQAGTEIERHFRRRGKRSPLPASLPRVRVVHDLAEADKICPVSGARLHQIGEELSEQLEMIPAKIQVIQHARLKYGCRCCGNVIRTAPLPPQPIPKSMASASLLANIAIAKYADGLPLNRQEKIIGRIGVDIPRGTLAVWMIKVGELLTPIINLMRDTLHSSRVIYMDETTVQVLHAKDKKPTSDCFMWVRVRAGPGPKVVDFEFDRTRSANVPRRLLDGYEGYLVTDGYKAYDAFCAENPRIKHGGDWVHVRRKFDEARKAKPDPSKATTANAALRRIAALFQIERDLDGLAAVERLAARRARSVSILDELRTWLDETLPKLPPKSLTGKALSYMNKEWPKLLTFLEDGDVAIHNNAAENAIRPFVVGRKAWLFSDRERGATASAAIYSVIETAKANGVEPWAYMQHVIDALPRASTIDDFERLLPWNESVRQALKSAGSLSTEISTNA